jgi:hypothetical protein
MALDPFILTANIEKETCFLGGGEGFYRELVRSVKEKEYTANEQISLLKRDRVCDLYMSSAPSLLYLIRMKRNYEHSLALYTCQEHVPAETR